MNRKSNILAAFLILALALLLTACGAGGDRVERFAEANPGSGENIAIPGYEKLSFAAGKTAQAVNLKNPPENACTFVLTLSLEGGEVLWTGKALSPGEAFTRITLSRGPHPFADGRRSPLDGRGALPRRGVHPHHAHKGAGRGRVPRNAPLRLLYHRG